MLSNKARQKNRRIIDKTLIELCRSNNNIEIEKVEDFAYLLKSMGVGFIEVDARFAGKLSNIPASMLVYRVETVEDVALCSDNNAKFSIVKCGNEIDVNLIELLYQSGISITMEIQADSIQALDKINNIFNIISLRFIDTIRLLGLREYQHGTWGKQINELRRNYMISIDLCPDNRLHCATAIAAEGLMNGIDYVTASFNGYGSVDEFAPLEEIMVSNVMLINPEETYNLSLLPQISSEFCNLANRSIPLNKPIIGRDIFKYESGIHAHGIEKNPLTYEPFDPEMVGQKREMTIGKHSGKKAVQKRLRELGINSNIRCLDALLDAIRTESVKLKRALADEELKSMIETGVCG